MPRPPSYRTFFKEVSENKWRIKGSGVRGYPSDAKYTNAIIELLKNSNVIVEEYTSGSPVNVDSHHVRAIFLDGGLYASTGNYWYSERGAWITGKEAFKFIVDRLHLINLTN
jgi:hypothetical protein